MGEEEDKFLEGIGEAYRLGRAAQAALFVLSVVLVVAFLEFLWLPLEVEVTAVVVTSAFAFPITVKERSRVTRACSLGLFLAAVSLMLWVIVALALPFWPPTQTTTLLIASVIAISIQLFQYLNPTILKRNKAGYTVILATSVVFTTLTCMSFNLLPPFGSLSVWTFVVFAIVFLLFTYAILPEKPI